ncbi:undecaprenyl-phosphate glucose phosphotransferase [Telluria mixta]|uniref:Undecaprenyl-phosphate glucose phosphotransferase n=2 Tax=Telluria mixta TaxID=34071 RepID=A0ABT2BRW2_9BURK|nr:undecaprenyl-phosphate glucose phosphotransferase [Telluria mixta]
MRINIENLADVEHEIAHVFPSATNIVRRILDPLFAAVAYLALAFWVDDTITKQDEVFAFVAALIFFPSTPVGTSLRKYASAVLFSWIKVLACLFIFDLVGHFSAGFNMEVVKLWAMLVPVSIIAMHTLGAPLKRRLNLFAATQTAVVIGASEVGKHLAHRLQSKSIPGQSFVGYFDDRPATRSGAGDGELLGVIDTAPEFVKRERIDMVYVALPMASQPRIMKLLDGLRDTTATVKFVPDMFIADLIQAKVENAAGLPVIAICDTPFVGSYGLQKRCFDLLVCLLALPVIAPLMLLIAVLIRATSAGPAFFKQRRYGLNGEEIVVWKFRSMKVMEDGDAVYKQATQDDDRITAVGKILRKTSLDELPQLINVLMGSMSLVGPRPHAVAVNENYRKQISGYMVRHKVKPGITGLAQVNGYRGGDDLHSMSKRIEYDLIYLRSWHLWLDVTIVFRTALMLLKGDPKAF